MANKNEQYSIQSPQENESQTGDEKQTVSGANLYQLLVSNQFRCKLSGVQLTPQCVSADHLIPISDGGMHEISNIQMVHETVNQMKGTMSNDEFVRWCRKVAQWNS